MALKLLIVMVFLSASVYAFERFAAAYRPDIDITKGSVEFDLGGDKFKVDISRPLNPFSKIKISILSYSSEKYEIVAAFNMKMDMGDFKTKFEYKKPYYEGEIILPKCIWGDKRWYVKLSFKKGGEIFTKVLLFDMSK